MSIGTPTTRKGRLIMETAKINVLSLFDGMSCGQIALDQLGIEVDNYYASEIDKYAIQIAKKNYPNTIHLGNVTSIYVKDKRLNLPQIDLLMGGSPCQGFSFAGKQLNFDDPRSVLFFEFVRLLKECKPKYFLLENVRMKKEFQNIISEYLGVEPIIINSSLLSAQNRVRLYWTNIPDVVQPEDKNIVLKDILEEDLEEHKVLCAALRGRQITKGSKEYTQMLEIRDDGKTNTLTTVQKDNVVTVNDRYYRRLTPIECERLQTVPDGYTEGISNSQRYKMIGNGWTVAVIKHLFAGAKKDFRHEYPSLPFTLCKL